MRKIYAVFIALMMSIGLGLYPIEVQAQSIWDGSTDITWYDASQSSFDISTPEQLAGLAQLVNNGTSNFSGKVINLRSDIWLNALSDSTNNWTTIGGDPTASSEMGSSSNRKDFNGTLHGHGHSIYNLYCDRGNYFQSGFFGSICGATIDSVAFINPTCKGKGMIGVIAGAAVAGGNDVFNSIMIVNARIIGQSSGNNIGCFVGASYNLSSNTLTATNCSATGYIYGSYPGGFGGNCEHSTYTNCYFNGTLVPTGSNHGGLSAWLGTFNNCYSNRLVAAAGDGRNGTYKDDTYMQSAAFLTDLGTAYKEDCAINNGYPILDWMICGVPVNGTLEICYGESTTLEAYGYDSYVWSTGATTAAITVSPTTTTDYYVTGTKSNGTVVTDTITVTVYPQAVITAEAVASSDGLVHGTVTLSSSTVPCGSTQTVTMTVTPDAYWHISKVVQDGVILREDDPTDGSVVTITIDPQGTLADVKVYFDNRYDITVAQYLEDGTALNLPALVAPWGDNGVFHSIQGDSAHYDFNGNDRYHITDVMIDGSSYGILNEYTFYDINQTHTIDIYYADSCGIFTIPTTEDFEIYTSMPECWTGHSTYSSAYPQLSVNLGASGLRSVYLYAYSGNYTMLVTPAVLDTISYPISMLQVNFNVRSSTTNGTLTVGVLSDPDNPDSFHPTQSFNFTSTNTWTNKTAFFPNYADGGNNIAFKWVGNGGLYIDDVTFDFAPDCGHPEDLVVDQITGSSARISWAPGFVGTPTDYTLEYSEAGQNNWTSVPGISTPTYMLGGLNPTTDYDVRVKSNCDDATSSEWLTGDFSTVCLAGGDIAIGEGSSTTPYFPAYNYYNYAIGEQLFTAAELGGPNTFNSISFNCQTANATSRNWDIYLMPTTQTSLSGLVSIDASAVKVFSGTAAISTGWFTINFDTAFVYDGTSNLILIVDDNTGSYVSSNYYYYHTNPTGNSYYDYNDNTNYDPANLSGNYSYSYRNNVIFGGECDNTVTCIAPNMTITNVTNSSADIVWVPGYQETSWEMEYKVSSDTDWTSLGSVSSMNETLNSLNANTSYDVRLRSDCGGEYSDWTMGTFRTECGAITSLPYFEDFETGVIQTSQDKYITCWDRYASNSAHYAYIGVGSSNAHSGNNYLDFHYTPDCFDIAIMPEIDASYEISTLMANFWLKRTNNLTTILEIGVMTDPSDHTTFEVVDTIEMPSYGTYTEITVGFSNYTGNGHYIAFRASNGNSAGFLLDDLTIDVAPFCSPITDLTISDVTGSSAQIHWNAGALGNTIQYTLEYSDAGMDSWTTVSNLDTNFYLLGGLEPNSHYDVRVMSHCDDGTNGEWVSTTFATACLVLQEIPVGNGTTTSYTFPVNNHFRYTYSQQIFLASELNTTTDVIDGISFQYANSSASTSKNDVKIYMGHTTKTSFVDADDLIALDSLVLVYSGHLNCEQGWNDFSFNTPFYYNGVDNIVVAVDDNSNAYNNTSYTFYTHSTNGVNMCHVLYSDSYNPDPANPLPYSGTNVLYTSRNNVKFFYCDVNNTCAAPSLNISNITESSAEIVWVPGYQESNWEMEYKRDVDTAWISLGSVFTMDETIDNLAANTLYNVRLRAVCGAGEYSTWTISSFRTDCGAISQLPYIETFDVPVMTEGSNYISCWDRYASNPEHYVYMYSDVPVPTGIYCLDFHWTPNCFNIAILSPMDNTINVSDLMASFYIQRTGTTSVFEVGVMTNKTDPTSFVAIDTIAAPNVNEWFYVNVPLTNYTGTGKYIAFRVSNGQNCGFRMDDITVDYTPSCWKPTDVASSNITTTSADITWSQVGNPTSWNIEYGPVGFTPGTGAGSTSLMGVSSPTNITGLTPATSYDVYVQADCGDGDLSQWSSVHTFNTVICDVEDQCGYYFIMHDGYGDGWNGNAIDIYSNDIFVTSVTLSNGASETVEVPLCHNSVTSFRWHTGNYADETSFEINDPFGVQIFACTSGATISSGSTFFTDTVNCTPPACPNPLNLAAFNPTTTTVELSWTQPGTPNQWNIEYGPTGFTQGTGIIVNANSNPYTLSSLNAATTYDVYVQADCGDGEVSAWSNVASFTTACNAVSLPYTENFDSYAGTEYDLPGPIPSCWTTATNNTAYPAPHVVSSGSYNFPHSGTNSLVFTCGSAGADAYAILPEFDQPLNTLRLNFFRQMEVANNGTLTVGYVPSANNTASFITLATIPSLSGTGDTITVDFTDISVPANGLIAFHWHQTITYYSCCIDDINVTVADNPGPGVVCDVPTGLAISNISQNSAVANWTAGGDETAWKLEYKSPAGVEWTSVTINNTPTYNFTNLEPNTPYFVRIQAVCDANNSSEWTIPISFTTLTEDVDFCPAPTNLAATDVQNEQVTLTWEQEENTASNWDVKYRTQGASSWSSVASTSTNFTLTGLTGLTTYEIQVVAHCTNGATSDPSNTVTVTTTNVGVNDYTLDAAISVYPNPTSGQFTIYNEQCTINSVDVYDVYGKLISTTKVEDTHVTLDINTYADGVYFARILTDKGVVTKRIVKK